MNIKFIEQSNLAKIIEDQDWIILDIRDIDSYSKKRIKRAIHISSIDLNGLEKDKKILVTCYHGNSSQMATFQLEQQGFKNAHSLKGGTEAAEKNNLE
jgi:thiosulfate sulfurtransferase